MKIERYILIDKRLYSPQDNEGRFLQRNHDRYPSLITQKNGRWTIQFCGVLWGANFITFVLPVQLNTATKSELDSSNISLMVRTLAKYEHEASENRAEDFYLKQPNEPDSEIALSLELIDDYERYGILSRTRTIKTLHPIGRVDWSRTIAHTQTVISESGPFYPTPIYKTQKPMETNPLSILHKSMVRHYMTAFGWMLHPKQKIDISQMDATPELWLPYSIQECLTILDNELSSSFSDRELFVIQTMRRLLQSLDRNQQRRRIAYGTRFFWEIWERGCKKLFDDDCRLYTELLPQPSWMAIETEKAKVAIPHISQRPDVLSILEDTLYVLDAKYYDYSRSLPGWEDIGKQYWYEKTMQAQVRAGIDRYMRLRETSNALLLPGPVGSGIAPIAYTSFSQEIMEELNLQTLTAFTVDIKQILCSYLDELPDHESWRRRYMNIIHSRSHSPIHHNQSAEA